MRFSLAKYAGLWYELLHYPSFFQQNDSYNTTAQYTLRQDGNMDVLNTTIVDGQKITSRGIAKRMGRATEFRVDFDFADVAKFDTTDDATPPSFDASVPNYVIKSVWFDEDDDEETYKFVVVSDKTMTSLWVLSRVPNPIRADYEKVLAYVVTHFDRRKMVATPHYREGC